MSAYDIWNAASRPLTPAPTIAEFVAQLRQAYPAHKLEFGWYADQAHYTAQPPLDHTPYSVDEWPVPAPGYVVFATDVMGTAVGGLDELGRLFDYWLSEARSGRAKWIKYLIWQATIYDVRHGWVPQPNAEHFDHVHISARTDVQTLGGWSATPHPREAPMRFVFNGFADAPSGVAGRVHISDGLRYRVLEAASTRDQLHTFAGAGPIVAVTPGGLYGWTYAHAVAQLCGTLDPGELAGDGGDQGEPIDWDARSEQIAQAVVDEIAS